LSLRRVAGIGVYFGDDDMRNVSAPLDRPPYTNQRAELAALLQALCIVLADPSLTNVTIATDSAYAKGCGKAKPNRETVTTWIDEWQKNGWRNSRNKPVKNQDLIEDTWTILKKAQKKATIHFVKVKGHSNIKGNEAADRLAAQANKK
jgi:ribonuclease HI